MDGRMVTDASSLHLMTKLKKQDVSCKNIRLHYDGEFRREEASSTVASHAKH